MSSQDVKITKEETGKKYKMENPSFDNLVNDPNLEEIAVNGPDEPVFVFHREQGRCETNLEMSEEDIKEIINDAAEESVDYINKSKPFLDARMKDGSRLNATIPPATPQGPTITITKFREEPFSIINLVKNGTLSYKTAAFLWAAVEGEKNYPLNLLVIGGTGSGKTTLLNTLMTFIPRDERITCIEDTLELNFFGRENVVRMISVPPTQSRDPVTMNDLLKNALRMRPDRLVTGEVRGKEAESLFNAMNVGHSAMGTLHANSPSELISRLTNPPMDVPKNMLPLIDLIVVMKKVTGENKMKRRVATIAEVSKSEVGISFNELFLYNPDNDEVERTDVPSRKIEHLADLAGKSLREVQDEMDEKETFLKDLSENDIDTLKGTSKAIQKYYGKKGVLV